MERKYSVILGNLGNTRDRFCSGYKNSPSTSDMLRQAASIPHVTGIELVGTWDIRSDNTAEMKTMLCDLGLECVSIIPDLFADPVYWKGSYSSKERSVRLKAIDYSRRICEIARELGCTTINVWPGQDGYDYILTADYFQGPMGTGSDLHPGDGVSGSNICTRIQAEGTTNPLISGPYGRHAAPCDGDRSQQCRIDNRHRARICRRRGGWRVHRFGLPLRKSPVPYALQRQLRFLG